MFGLVTNAHLLAKLNTIAAAQAQTLADVLAIIKLVTPAPKTAVKIALELPRITRKGVIMPNYELPNDEVATITIKTTDAAGDVEAVDPTDVFTAVSSNPASLGVAIGKDAAGNPAIVLTPLVQNSPGLTVTVSDSKGLKQAVQLVDIVPDVTPTNIILDLVDASQSPQAVPTAPGP